VHVRFLILQLHGLRLRVNDAIHAGTLAFHRWFPALACRFPAGLPFLIVAHSIPIVVILVHISPVTATATAAITITATAAVAIATAALTIMTTAAMPPLHDAVGRHHTH